MTDADLAEIEAEYRRRTQCLRKTLRGLVNAMNGAMPADTFAGAERFRAAYRCLDPDAEYGTDA